MPLTGDMRRLCDRLAYDHDRRWDAVHAMRENALRTMADIREAHKKRIEETRQRMNDLNATRDRMTADQRHRMTQFRSSLRDNVSEFVGGLEEAHRDRACQIDEHIHDLGAARIKMGAEQAQMLMEFHNDLHDGVREFVGELEETHKDRAEEISRHIHDMGTARMKMGAEQEQMLAEFHADLHDSVGDFVSGLEEAHKDRAKEVEGELHHHGTDRRKMSAEQQRKLTKEHERLAATVNQTRKELRTDAKRAHQVWTDFAAKTPHREKKGEAAHVKPAPAARAARGGGATAAADDLTTIPGIGPNRQQRLNELGIDSFAHLAHTTEARLRDALGPSARLADVGRWIEEAKKHV